MFIIKKLLGQLLMPLPFSLMLLLSGLCLLWFCSNKDKAMLLAKLLISLGTSLLIISSLPFSSQLISTRIERQYAPLLNPPADLKYIIVLGSGHVSDPFLPAYEQLSETGRTRIMAGISLTKTHPQATLILSGYGGSDLVSYAQVANVVAQNNGISPSRIQVFESPKDTAQEAQTICELVRSKPAILVSSATHMPRALALFAEQGCYPIPAPVGFLGKIPQQSKYWYEQLPQSRELQNVTTAWHEVIGMFWQKLLKIIQ